MVFVKKLITIGPYFQWFPKSVENGPFLHSTIYQRPLGSYLYIVLQNSNKNCKFHAFLQVQIGGHNVTTNFGSAFQLLGYCPQHNALWYNVTLREHLETYAAIRGVPKFDIPR